MSAEFQETMGAQGRTSPLRVKSAVVRLFSHENHKVGAVVGPEVENMGQTVKIVLDTTFYKIARYSSRNARFLSCHLTFQELLELAVKSYSFKSCRSFQ